MLLNRYYFIFILFTHKVHANFRFNQCSIYTECFFLALKKIQMVKITPRQILITRQPTPLAKSAYFYMDMNCFRLVRVVWSWLRVSSVAVDSFGWVFSDGCRWFQVVSEGFGWFAVLVVTFFVFL